MNLLQTYFLYYKFFSVYSSFYYKSIIVVNSLFFLINLSLEYIDEKKILLFFFQILINIFNIIYIKQKDILVYNEIQDDRRSLSSNQDYPEATYL